MPDVSFRMPAIRPRTLLVPLAAAAAVATGQVTAAQAAPAAAVIPASAAPTADLGNAVVLPAHGTPAGAKAIARRLMRKYDWNSAGQFRCLDRLWTKESDWRVHADNPTSSAYGIPQALPGYKMGPGWQHNPTVQIRWGLGYIDDRYGTPCRAWAHSQRHNWY